MERVVALTLEGQVADLEALVRALLGRNDRCVADQWVVNARVWNQVGLELVQVYIEGTIETQTGCDGTDDLGDEAVKVLEVGTGDV